MKNKILLFWGIVALVIVAIVIIFKMPTKLGLDLVGGSRFLLEAQTTPTIAEITPDMMDSLQYAIDRRVNKNGVSETVVQRQGDKRLVVEIPNVQDLEKAKRMIGETAELTFKKEVMNGSEQTWVDTGLTGNDLRRASLGTSPNGQWEVDLEFNDSGTKKFGELTQQLVGKQMAIFFNGELMSAPVIREPIMGGRAQITGGDNGFALDDAKEMVDFLNAGALPIPAKIIQENTVGATLGADSIEKSKFAGAVGLGIVILFMIAYYRLPGLIADIALVIYAILLFAIFKVVGVTLTLAGIAGFILSIGMAVDANILIFERTKEELRAGRTLFTAINAGFDRAFTSIFDSNMTTIITCAILYYCGTNIVKGFAITLALGVIVSMFSAITVTKNFMHLIFGTGELKYPALFGLKRDEIGTAYKASETKREKAKFGVLD
ncbi:protein translocase subunit SecD [bacterium]|nr:protein translocase subunit SecD [bacterium]